MSLVFQDSELNELMKDFYLLTGIRIILIDANQEEIACYPPFEETFCADLRKNKGFNEKCIDCDRKAFARCKKSKTLDIYKCHAGLIDATVPIFDGDRLLGYMMLGQITNERDKAAFQEKMIELCKECGIEDDLSDKIKKIKYRNERQIKAASKILETCAHYIHLKEIIKPSGQQLIDAIDRYIDDHISEDISIGRLCEEFHIGRTHLYEVMHTAIDGGIANYIKHKRLKRAETLIKTTSMSVAEISCAVGFMDYNYFSHVFKLEYGIPPKAFKKMHSQQS